MTSYAQITNQNVTISTYSPRPYGQHAARSEWQEIPYNAFRDMTAAQRIGFVDNLTAFNPNPNIKNYSAVWVKTATNGGRARIFVKLG